MTEATKAASATVRARIETQSSVRQAGTMPVVENQPRVGFRPTILLKPAGTRPEPAVSVPRANGTNPRATTEADPELEPPLMYSGRKVFGTIPYGERVPTRPVANWSRLVLPATMAPASRSRRTTVASDVGMYANCGQAAVVGHPATSMLSLTAKGTP